MVFRSGVYPLVMIPLEITHKAVVTPNILNNLTQSSSPFSQLIHELLSFFSDTYEKVFGFKDGPPLHDPCAIAYVIDSDLFTLRQMKAEVVCGDGPCSGQTVCDIWGYKGHDNEGNLLVAMTWKDLNQFWKLMEQAYSQADQVSPLNKG